MRKSTRNSHHQPQLQHLEGRCLLAGNVFVGVCQGNLFIVGDAQDNDIQVIQTGSGQYTVAPGMGTTVNGSAANFTASGVNDDILISMGAGIDSLGLLLVAPDDLIIDMGSGDDGLSFGGFLDAPRATPQLPDPTISVHVLDDLIVNMGGGNDFFGIFESRFEGKTDIFMGQGDDTLLVAFSTFVGDTDLHGGAGTDTFINDENHYPPGGPTVTGFEG